jgi:hypothetical protein
LFLQVDLLEDKTVLYMGDVTKGWWDSPGEIIVIKGKKD